MYDGAKLIVDQAPKGKRKDWAFTLSVVYVLVLIDGFAWNYPKVGIPYLHDICLCNRDSGEVFQEELEIIYLELGNFYKQIVDLQGDLDKWLFVLKDRNKLHRIPLFFDIPSLKNYSN